MGRMEQLTAVRMRRGKVQDAVLQTLGVMGAMSIMVLAPNAAVLLKHVDLNFKQRRHPTARIRKSIQRLKEQGMISMRTEKGVQMIALTDHGKRLAALIEAEHVQIKRPRRWDGKWRILIFDIKEQHRNRRDRIRVWLTRVGFVRLQDSVWVHPFPCDEIIALLKVEMNLRSELLYVIAEGIEGDRWLRRAFRLPLR